MSKILIAGGTGLIGRELTKILLESDHDVVHLSRSTRLDATVPTYTWDISQKYIEPAALDTVDYVINLAGAGIADKRWSDSRKKQIVDSRVQGNLLFKQYIQEGKLSPKKFISGAAIGVYGNRGTEVLTEESKVRNDGFLAESCIQWEDSIQSFKETNVPVAFVRIGIVLSTKGGALEKMLQPAKLGLGSYFGDGSQIYSWVHITDIARMFEWLITEDSAVGVYNGTAPNPVSNKKLTKVLMEVKSGPGITAPVPSFALNLLLGEMKQVVMWGSHVIPRRLLESNFNFEYKWIEDALQDLVG